MQADFGVGSRCLCQASFEHNSQREALHDAPQSFCVPHMYGVDLPAQPFALMCIVSTVQVQQRSLSAKWHRRGVSPTMCTTWTVSLTTLPCVYGRLMVSG